MDLNGISRRIIPVILSCVLFSAATVHADTIQRLSASPARGGASHLQDGERFYEQRKDLKAADRFVRVLLLDPASRRARERLQEMLKDSAVLSQHQRLQLQRFVDLVDYHQFLLNRMDGLFADSRQYSMQIRHLLAPSRFSVELTQTIDRAGQIAKETAQYRRIWMSDDIPSVLPMDAIFAKLDMTIQRLEEQHRKLTKVCTQLRQQHLAARNSKTPVVPSKAKKGSPSGTERPLTGHQKRIQDFRGELKTVKREFEVLQKKFEETNARVAEVTSSLAEVSLELFEKEKVIADKDSQMSQLGEQLQETRERMNLVQRIIQEKDQHIQVLQADIRALQSLAEHGEGQAGTAAFNPEDGGRLADMQKQLNELSDKYNFLVDKIQERDLAIAQLRGTIAERNEQIDHVHQAVKTQEEEIGLLNGIVQIYQGRLVDVYSSLKEKEEEMNALQWQLLELGVSVPASLKETVKAPPPDPPRGDLAAQSEEMQMNPVFFNGMSISPEDVLKETKENIMQLQLRDKLLPR